MVKLPLVRHRLKAEPSVVLFGLDLKDAREEVFVRLVCDGLALGVAYKRAGFTSKHAEAPSLLFHLPRVQERAAAILEARRTQGVVTLSEVTDMLQRVFAGAHSEGEYSAAHNAAFSLARLYGHVTDKSTLEVIRRPSRDPDAPSEQALSSWVESLPALPAPSPEALSAGLEPALQGFKGAFPDAPAGPLGQVFEAQAQSLNEINSLDEPEGPGPAAGLGPQSDLLNDINWLGGLGPQGPGLGKEFPNEIKGLDVAGRSENGAPTGPVTGTPNTGGRADLLGPGGPGPKPKRVPPKTKRVPVKKRGKIKKRKLKPRIPSAKQLFG
jgi:hypothetical protein